MNIDPMDVLTPDSWKGIQLQLQLQLQRIRTRHLRKPLPITKTQDDPNGSAACNKFHCLKRR